MQYSPGSSIVGQLCTGWTGFIGSVQADGKCTVKFDDLVYTRDKSKKFERSFAAKDIKLLQ